MSTFVGKILVVVITAVSLLFLGISTVVFATSKNWQTAFRDPQKKLDDLKKELSKAQSDADVAAKGLEDAKAALATETKNLGNRLSTLEEENKRNLEQINSVREQLVSAQATAQSTLEQVEAKRKQIEVLHQQKHAVEKQATHFKQHESELTDRIRELERILEPAVKNQSELQKPSRKLSALIN
jgi:chromosome segregation ATPase